VTWPESGRGELKRWCDGDSAAAVELIGGNGASVVGSGEKVVKELQGEVGKLGVEAIVVEEGRREVSHGEQEAAAGGDRRQLVGEPVWCTRGPIEGS
jgi:hypothetical protein